MVEKVFFIFIMVALVLGFFLAAWSYELGYKHTKIEWWLILLLMIFGTPLSASLYIYGAKKSKREKEKKMEKPKPSRYTERDYVVTRPFDENN